MGIHRVVDDADQRVVAVEQLDDRVECRAQLFGFEVEDQTLTHDHRNRVHVDVVRGEHSRRGVASPGEAGQRGGVEQILVRLEGVRDRQLVELDIDPGDGTRDDGRGALGIVRHGHALGAVVTLLGPRDDRRCRQRADERAVRGVDVGVELRHADGVVARLDEVDGIGALSDGITGIAHRGAGVARASGVARQEQPARDEAVGGRVGIVGLAQDHLGALERDAAGVDDTGDAGRRRGVVDRAERGDVVLVQRGQLTLVVGRRGKHRGDQVVVLGDAVGGELAAEQAVVEAQEVADLVDDDAANRLLGDEVGGRTGQTQPVEERPVDDDAALVDDRVGVDRIVDPGQAEDVVVRSDAEQTVDDAAVVVEQHGREHIAALAPEVEVVTRVRGRGIDSVDVFRQRCALHKGQDTDSAPLGESAHHERLGVRLRQRAQAVGIDVVGDVLHRVPVHRLTRAVDVQRATGKSRDTAEEQSRDGAEDSHRFTGAHRSSSSRRAGRPDRGVEPDRPHPHRREPRT